MTKTPQAILYARFSPRRDPNDSESIAHQLDECRKLCGAREWPVLAENWDEALSGDDCNRPGLWEAVALVRRGHVLVVHKQDRLARDPYLLEAIYRTVAKAGGEVHVVDGVPNGDDPTSTLIRQIMSAVSAWEKKIIAARTKLAMAKHQADGRVMGSQCPYGWQETAPIKVNVRGQDRMRRLMTHCPEEQAVIQQIRNLYRLGHRAVAIANHLNRDGIKARHGGEWTESSVRSIIKREGLGTTRKQP